MENSANNDFAARSQKFDSQHLSVGDLRADKARFVIPPYQRPYAWSAEQVSQLMQDLLDFFLAGNARNTYSLGTIVCDEETPGFFSILDGQQRLTTIDLLLEEIGSRLERKTVDTPPRIISAYRYLAGMETSYTSPQPACASQRDCIAGALNQFIDEQNRQDEQSKKHFFEAFEACILERVKVLRVVIPLSDRVRNEAPAMFEIINMRGQKLSALDILKSRLLSRFGDKDRYGRALFAHLWSNTEECLASPQKAAAGCSKPGGTGGQPGATSPTNAADDSLSPAGMTIEEILSSKHSFANSLSKPSENGSGNAENFVDDAGEQYVAPIDMMNMLVIACELAKNEKWKSEASAENSDPDYRALATKDFGERFNPIVQSEEGSTADVWRLMGALSVVLQTVGNWGRYRKADGEEYFGKADAFNQLIQSFMAANSFRTSAQYWLLVLSATALENCLGSDGQLPQDPTAYLGMKKPDFAKIRKLAELRLLIWAYHVAEYGQSDATKAVFSLIRETASEESARLELKKAQASVRNAAKSWSLSNGSVSQFDLFFTDYVLWADGHRNCEGGFALLKHAKREFIDRAQATEELEIADAFRNFDWADFSAKACTLRIVGRSDIEHWLSRDRASLGKEGERSEQELLCRHGYGNLALINQGDNISLGKEAPAGKSELVLLRMSNPTAKLLWLAILSKKFPGMSGRHVRGLTDFWADYIGTFAFD